MKVDECPAGHLDGILVGHVALGLEKGFAHKDRQRGARTQKTASLSNGEGPAVSSLFARFYGEW